MRAPSRLAWPQWLLLAAALLFFALQAGWSSTHKSAAFDEQYHLAAGYAYLRTGDFRLATNHPPLAGWLAALPLWGDTTLVLPVDHPAWQAGDRFLFSDLFLWESGNDAQSLLVRARGAITLLGTLLVAGLFFAARQLFGGRAGWLALLLAVTEPNLIAHSRFVTTDLPLTLFLFAAVWGWWRWLARPRWPWLLLAGICAGLAMGTKYNAALLWAIFLGMVLLTERRARWGHAFAGLAVAALAAGGVLWALFRFTVGPISLLPEWLILPAPHYWQWLWNTVTRILDLQGARVDFFLGEVSTHSWWYYFFVAAGLKLSVPLLLLAGAGSFALVRDRTARRLALLWLPPALFLLLGATQVLNIGFRHMLPTIPFLILLAAGAGRSFPLPSLRPLRPAFATLLLVGWLAADTTRIAPHYESFFNQLAGPWPRWSQLLVDSNLDWGQDLIALRQKMDELDIETVELAYFGKAAPEAYGVRYRPLPSYLRFMEGREIAAYNPYTPAPGWYAISATALRTGTMTPATAALYQFFQERPPDARAGYSIYLYNVSWPAESRQVSPVVLGQPLWQLSPADLGIVDGTWATVKWVESPDSTVFPAGQPVAALQDPRLQQVDANFSDVLTLVGYLPDPHPAHPGSDLALQLYWRVGVQPMPQPAPTRGAPISAFVHRVDGDPTRKIAEFDSWNVALRGLAAGDIVEQRLLLPIGETVAPNRYDLLVGLYSPQNWQRLTVTQAGEMRDHAVAGKITVQP